MNDTELDEMLNQWDAPEVPRRLHEELRAELREKQRKRDSGWPMRWLGWLVPAGKLFAGAAVGSVVFLVIMVRIQASPQTPGIHVPWTVDSELIKYADNGTSSVEMNITSYKLNSAAEVLLSRSAPGNPIKNLLGTTIEEVGAALRPLVTTFTIDPAMLEKFRKMQREHPGIGLISGCGDELGCLTLAHYGFMAGNSCIAGTIVGHETILNHPTEAVRKGWMYGRMTVWTAADLACFAMRVTYEEPQSNGTFKVVRAKQAVKVTVNP